MNTTRSGTGVRVATAAILVPATVAAVWFGPVWLVALLVALVTLACMEEFLALGAQQGLGSYRLWTHTCALAVVAAQWNAAVGGGGRTGGSARRWLVSGDGPPAMGVELALLAFVLGIAAMVVLGHRALKDVLPSVGTSASALLLIALPFSYMVRLQGLDDGRIWLLFTLALVWLGDTLAYFVGRRVGRLPLAPQISPQKTWEGAAANVVGALLAAAVFSMWLDVGVMHLFTIAVLASLAGQFGDLLESAYKRGAGVKDSGALLPGHGGLLDRVDALIFAAPVVWVYAVRLY
ncbi:MAG: phosphatidate cytidylyltransferase [Candidatus Acidiferrales bacterium]